MKGLKEELSTFWDSVAEGWQHMRQAAAGAITRFKPSAQTNMPTNSDIDDAFFIPSTGWSMLGGDLFEDDKRLVVRLEVPGLDKNDLDIEMEGEMLIVRGEKRFERESTEGRYRVLQCAYGSFRRAVPLPVPVVAEKGQASYRNGVLRIELPKAEIQSPRKMSVKVD
jgi:HSP20 family protein